VVTDRLGSVRANTQGEKFAYFPYGEERTTTPDGREKFGTYFRDGVGQDYAVARYYGSGTGSFWSADPGGIKTVHPGDPVSWNRYAYAAGDPINQLDPGGTDWICVGYSDDPTCYDAEDDNPPGGSEGGANQNGPNVPIKNPPQHPGSRYPACNPTANQTTEAKLAWVAQSYPGAIAEANQVESDLQEFSPNLTTNTQALADAFLDWSATESGYGQNAANVAEHNFFGMQNAGVGGWNGTEIQCPVDPSIAANSKNACFATSLTWGQELGAVLSSVSAKTGATYLSAMENALISGSNAAGAIQAIATNGWNASPTYGQDVTTGMSLISCMSQNGYLK
jgi:RHS repeat-associated protein